MPFLTSLDCQRQASDYRHLARQSPSPQMSLQISRIADMWEALAIEIELNVSRERNKA
jgi:hypothetical protein